MEKAHLKDGELFTIDKDGIETCWGIQEKNKRIEELEKENKILRTDLKTMDKIRNKRNLELAKTIALNRELAQVAKDYINYMKGQLFACSCDVHDSLIEKIDEARRLLEKVEGDEWDEFRI